MVCTSNWPVTGAPTMTLAFCRRIGGAASTPLSRGRRGHSSSFWGDREICACNGMTNGLSSISFLFCSNGAILDRGDRNTGRCLPCPTNALGVLPKLWAWRTLRSTQPYDTNRRTTYRRSRTPIQMSVLHPSACAHRAKRPTLAWPRLIQLPYASTHDCQNVTVKPLKTRKIWL
jgi:hypothetical protein